MKFVCKWALPVVMCSVLSVGAFARDKKKHKDVPESGSSLVYLSIAAAVCVGAVTVKSRAKETEKLKA